MDNIIVNETEEDLKKTDTRDHRGRTNNIIRNNYNSVEFVTEEIKFNSEEYVDEGYVDIDEILEENEYTLYIQTVMEEEEFKIFNEVKTIVKPNHTYQKVYQIKKKDINNFYGRLIVNEKLDKYKLYLYMCYYLNIEKNKIFDMLSNFYKNQIINQITKSQKIFEYKLI